MKNEKSDLRAIVAEVLFGIAFLCVIEEVIAILFIGGPLMEWSKLKVTVVLGLLVGSLLGAGLFLHMKKSVIESLAYKDERGVSYIRRSYFFRMAITAMLMIAAFYTGWVNILAMLFGILNLKFGVYMEPFTHRLFSKKQSKSIS